MSPWDCRTALAGSARASSGRGLFLVGLLRMFTDDRGSPRYLCTCCTAHYSKESTKDPRNRTVPAFLGSFTETNFYFFRLLEYQNCRPLLRRLLLCWLLELVVSKTRLTRGCSANYNHSSIGRGGAREEGCIVKLYSNPTQQPALVNPVMR